MKKEQKSAHRLPELLRQAAKFIFRRFPLRIPVWVKRKMCRILHLEKF